AAAVRVSFHPDLHGGPRPEHVCDLIQQGKALRHDGRPARGKEDRLVKLDLLLGDRNQRVFLGTAVFLGWPWLVGALVNYVGNTVLVVVGVRAAILVLKSVLVLGFVGALVERIGDTVLVVVEVGATVLVLKSVLVLRFVGTLVERVGDAVTIRVQGARRGRSHHHWFSATARRRQAQGLAGVGLCSLDVIQRSKVVASVKLALGEFHVGLGKRQGTGSALVGPVLARPVQTTANAARPYRQILTGTAKQQQPRGAADYCSLAAIHGSPHVVCSRGSVAPAGWCCL